jgi:hypothetical protein
VAESPGLDLVASYVAEMLERADALGELAESLRAEEYISPEPLEMISMVEGLSLDFKEVIVQRWEKYQSTKARKHLIFLRAVDEALHDLTGDLRLPARATSERVPGNLTRLVRAKLDEIFPGCGLILRPQWGYSYKVHRDDIGTRYTTRLVEILPTQDRVDKHLSRLQSKPLFVISFPIIERRSIHLHSVLGHEIGHLLARKYEDPSEDRDQFKEFMQRLYRQNVKVPKEQSNGTPANAEASVPDAVEPPVENEPRVLDAIEARRVAIREFAADAGSVYLFGISALLGAADVAMSKGLRSQRGDSPGKYPTWAARLTQMLLLARRLGWLTLSDADVPANSSKTFREATAQVRQRVKEIDLWVKSDGAAEHPPNPWVAEGHAAARKLIPRIHSFLDTTFPRAVFGDPSRTLFRLPALYKRLELGVPPDNVGDDEIEVESPRVEDIFAASWWWRLSRVKPVFLATDLSPAVKREAETLRRLTLKAIENVDFVSRYRSKIRSAKDKAEMP